MTPAERITLAEAAELLGVHYMTAYRYVRTGRLPAARDGMQWTVDPADVRAMRRPSAGRRRRGTTGVVRSEAPARLAARLVAGDEAGAWSVVDSALAAGVDPAEIYLDVLAPALHEIGDGWQSGELTVADEHRATAIAQRVVGRLGPMMARRGRKRGTVIVGAPAGELHALPCAIVSDLLRAAGFDVADLGANTPSESFMQAAEGATRLVAVLVGVTTRGRDREVRAIGRALRRAGVDAPVLVGGAAIPDEAAALALGANGWSGVDGAAARAAVEALAKPPSGDRPGP